MKIVMLLADYANVTENGKLNVLGMFSQINAKQFPAQHPAMVVVVKIGLDIGEQPVKRAIAIRLLSQDSQQLVEITGDIQFQRLEDGSSPEVNLIMGLNNVVFPAPGTYEFVLLIDEKREASVPIQLNQLPSQ